MPFTVTVDKSKIASPTAALYVRVANKAAAAAAAAPAKGNNKDKEPRPFIPGRSSTSR